MSDTEFQDQGSLDQPAQNTDGPVNPVRDEHITNPAGLLQAQEEMNNQNVVEADNTSASTLALVNEAREAGEPLDGSLPEVDQPSVTPAGTGVAEPANDTV